MRRAARRTRNATVVALAVAASATLFASEDVTARDTWVVPARSTTDAQAVTPVFLPIDAPDENQEREARPRTPLHERSFRVVDFESGEAIPGAAVAWFHHRGGARAERVEFAPDGAGNHTGDPDEDAQIAFEAPNYVTRHMRARDATEPLIRLRPLANRPIYVSVRDPSGRPIAGARLRTGDSQSACTDEHGTARFVLPGGRPSLHFEGHAWADGFLTAAFTVLDTGTDRNAITTEYHSGHGSAIVLHRRADLEGHIVDDSLRPLANARLVVRVRAEAIDACGVAQTPAWTAYSDGLGAYSIEGLPAERELAWTVESATGEALGKGTFTLPPGRSFRNPLQFVDA